MASVNKALYLLVIMVLPFKVWTQSRTFSQQEFQRDYSIFRSSLEECHPGLYWYRTRPQIDSAFDAGFAQVARCTTERQFVMTLDRMVSFIGCMHTGVNPSKAYRTEFWKDIKLMPVEFKMLGEKTYVYKNGSDRDDLIPGTEVTHINGLSMDSIRQLIFIHDSADGYTRNWSIASKSPHLGWFLAAYVGKSDRYRLTCLSNNITYEVDVAALSQDEIKRNREKRYGVVPTQVPFIRLSFRKDLSTAILHVDRFDNWRIGKDKVEFLDVLEKTMKEIVDSGVRNLIIDVGDKGGGNEYFGLKIISHLVKEPFKGYTNIQFTNKKFKSMKYSNTSWLEYLYYRKKLKFRALPDGTYTIRYIALDPVAPSPVQFTGDVYVIIGGMTASATSDFAAQLHGLKRATFIGEETGGAYAGNTSNFEFGIKLPETKSMLYIPLSRYFNNVDQKLFFGYGLKPDYEVIPTIDDVLDNVDTQLQFTLTLIQKKYSAVVVPAK